MLLPMNEASPARGRDSGHQAGRDSGHRTGPLSGRQAEAARNDQRILDSARAVFVNDPDAPITAVAKHAGVGISALYSRYGSKEELLRKLCTDGLLIVVAETEAAITRVENGRDHWQVFADFMRHLVDADTSSMTLALAGKFAPTPEMFALANRSSELMSQFFAQVKDALRPDLVLHDVSLAFELVAAVKLADPERTAELRHRYLALILDGMRATGRAVLPGPPPGWQELSGRWSPAKPAS
jgi:AcrR family transcriptional regulator